MEASHLCSNLNGSYEEGAGEVLEDTSSSACMQKNAFPEKSPEHRKCSHLSQCPTEAAGQMLLRGTQGEENGFPEVAQLWV